jgi:hypothetical protein
MIDGSDFVGRATVKRYLTVQLVSNTYQFVSREILRRQIESSQPVSDFDRTLEQIKKLGAGKPKRVRKGDLK